MPKIQSKSKTTAFKKTDSNIALKNNSKLVFWICLGGILLVSLIVFLPSLSNNFTNWDDQTYVLNNSELGKPIRECAKYFFSNIYFNNYHPLTMMVYALEFHNSQPVQNISANPETFHIVNLLFHLLNIALVFYFILLLSSKRLEVACFVALLFSIHPMHVESVAWISELKDVLYCFFFMAGLICYLRYINNHEKISTSIGIYILTFVLFVLSCLSKPAAVTFTLMLPLLDFYTNRKLSFKVWLEKLPFFIVSIILGIITFKAQQSDSIAKLEAFTIPQHLMFGCYSMINYLYKLFLPINLSALHPYPIYLGKELNLSIIFYVAPLLVILLFIVAFWTRKYSRIIIFGFLFFFLNIVLVLQFITVGNALVAERYTYIPYIGLFFILGMGFSWVYRNNNPRIASYKSIITVAFAVIVLTFSFLSNARCKVWFNSDSLWSNVIDQYPENAEAYKNRGGYLTDKSHYDIDPGANDFDRAFNDYNKAISLNPSDPKLFLNRANVFAAKEKYELALTDYSAALSMDSSDYSVYLNRGIAYSQMEKYDSAFADWGHVIKHDGASLKLYQNRAFAYLRVGKFQAAVDDYSKLISMSNLVQPNVYFFRGIAYFQMKNYEAALADNSKAIDLGPNYREAYYNRSQVNYNLKRFKNSLEDILKAKSLGYDVDPTFIEEIKKNLSRPL